MAPAQTCPHCGAPASGRFCSACGKELALHATSASVLSDTFGVKAPPWQALARTAWLTLTAPAEVSRRWIERRPMGLASPVAMMGTVTALTAMLGFVLARVLGLAPQQEAVSFAQLLQATPFLQSPRALAFAAQNDAGMVAQLKAIASYLAALWPALFIVPGYLALAPWRRVTSHAALILACVESVFLLMMSAAYSLLQIALPGPMGGLMALLLPLATIAHGAWHVQRLTGAGWGYAVSRPVIAAVLFPVGIYAFTALLMALTITLGPG